MSDWRPRRVLTADERRVQEQYDVDFDLIVEAEEGAL